jgi:hypothetical protein
MFASETGHASKTLSAQQILPALRSAVRLAEKVGARLESGEILFRALPAGAG